VARQSSRMPFNSRVNPQSRENARSRRSVGSSHIPSAVLGVSPTYRMVRGGEHGPIPAPVRADGDRRWRCGRRNRSGTGRGTGYHAQSGSRGVGAPEPRRQRQSWRGTRRGRRHPERREVDGAHGAPPSSPLSRSPQPYAPLTSTPQDHGFRFARAQRIRGLRLSALKKTCSLEPFSCWKV
jgi:hypothetical protein